MNSEAVDVFWKGGIMPIINKLDTLIGSVVANCHVDSYEVGTANWTANLTRFLSTKVNLTLTQGVQNIKIVGVVGGYNFDKMKRAMRVILSQRRMTELAIPIAIGTMWQLKNNLDMKISSNNGGEVDPGDGGDGVSDYVK